VKNLLPFLVLAACTRTGDADLFPPPLDAGVMRYTSPTFYEDVLPIIVGHCIHCHDGTSIGAFSLDTYADAVKKSSVIPFWVEHRLMPPYAVTADGSCNSWKDATSLSNEQIQTLSDWTLHGHLIGDPRHAPPPATPLPTLDNPTVTLDPGAPYTPSTALTDDYRCFVVDAGLSADAFLTAWQLVPGDRPTVHHAILYRLETDAAAATAQALDAADPLSGYACPGDPGTGDATPVATWQPDQGVVAFDPGAGVRLPRNRKMVLQIHYALDMTDHLPDHSLMRLRLAPTVVDEITPVVVSDSPSLPAGTDTARDSVSYQVPADALLRAVLPRMGELGVSQYINLRSAGNDSCVADVAVWKAHWLEMYQLAAPISVRAGDTITVGCTYDTTVAAPPISEKCEATLYLTPR
jgi:hypothetical protein